MIAKAKYGDMVTVHFTCKLDDGTVVDSSDGRESLEITIGKSGFIKSFERAFIGMEPGEKKTVMVPADQAYGPYKDELKQVLSREQFPGDIQPEVGMQFKVKTDNDEQVIRVVEVTESSVALDANHHLAGKDLFFDISLVDIIKPGPSANAYFILGTALQEQGLFEEAIQHYNEAIETDPDFTDVYFKLGILYQIMGLYDEAMSNYRKVLQLKADHMEAMINLGNILRIEGKVDEAISYFNQALVINPDYASTYNNLGVAFKDKGDLDDAMLHYKKALELDDGFAEAHNNLGMALQEKAKFKDAENSFRKAIQLNGNLAEAHFNLSSILLLSGNFQDGWKEYEWRLKLKEFDYTSTHTLWDGADIAGRSLLLYAEQGFGDTIQFMRYAPFVAERGITVIVECQQELAALLRRVKGVNTVITFGESLPTFDFQCHLLSLPRIFNTTLANIPADTPYTTADPLAVRQWKEKMASDQSKFKVGIAWAGDPSYKKDHLRSLRLKDLKTLLRMKDISFYQLQKENSADQELPIEEELKLIDFTYLIEDFADTAALIENLDLIISVDTSVAHLAGALGKTVWTLLPYIPDWRWMLDREDSPWYPTMKLFRQPAPGDWDSVMKQVAEELKKIDVK
jgi:FKBP-type peptidyl-prolyl cis-trans isomerase 2